MFKERKRLAQSTHSLVSHCIQCALLILHKCWLHVSSSTCWPAGRRSQNATVGVASVGMLRCPWNKGIMDSTWILYQWLFLVPVKGGRDYITSQKAIYKWYIYVYILLIGWLYTTYQPLQEPEKSIDYRLILFIWCLKLSIYPNLFFSPPNPPKDS